MSELDRKIRRRTFELLVPWPVGLLVAVIAGPVWGLVGFIWACTLGLVVEALR